MIGIVNYGLGNVMAIQNLYNYLDIDNILINNIDDFKRINKIILPGVGSFDGAMALLNESGFSNQIKIQVLNNKKPILGICVGMQVLAKSSEEGKIPGLGLIDAKVKLIRYSSNYQKLRIPHMGWNSVKIIKDNPLFDNRINNEFYFLHSYIFVCNQKSDIILNTEYVENFASGINKQNIYGVQFHPEKSHSSGLELLKNFALKS